MKNLLFIHKKNQIYSKNFPNIFHIIKICQIYLFKMFDQIIINLSNVLDKIEKYSKLLINTTGFFFKTILIRLLPK